MENNEPEPGRELTAEERLQRLEEEAALLRQELASQKAEALDAVPEPEPEPVREVSSADLEKAEKLVQRAHLERSRGQKDMANQYLQEAEALAPTSSVVLEALGDGALADRRSKAALEYYRKAKDADPKNSSAERKHADLVFQTSAAGAALAGSASDSLASAKSATLLSTILPGLGQMTMGMYVKGAIFMGLWVVIMIVVIATKVPAQIAGIVTGKVPLEPVAPFTVLGGFVVWIINIVDMNTSSSVAAKRTKLIDHPQPPIDGMKF